MIDCLDILRGFVKNFHGLNLHFSDTKTKTTRKVLQYFTELGEILGYYVAIEDYDRQDLVWEFNRGQDKKWILHLETEGKYGTERNIEKTFPRLKTSKARLKIAIMYSNMQEIENEILIYKEELENWSIKTGNEVMFIISDWLALSSEKELFNEQNHPLIALHKNGSKDKIDEIRGYQWKVDENDFMNVKVETE